MKSYSTAAAALALGVSEQTIIEVTGTTNGKLTLPQILELEDNAKIKRYHEEAESIRKIISGVKELEA